MDEARRFLRYVMPGLVAAIQCGVFLAILVPDWIWRQGGHLKEDAGLGTAAALFVASGGIGYLLSVLHHSLHWLIGPPIAYVDHRAIISDLSEKHFLRVVDWEGREVKNLDRKSAWQVETSFWRMNEDQRVIKAATPGVDALANQLHSAGTARIGTSVDSSNPAINRHFKTRHFRSAAETQGVLLRSVVGTQVGVDFGAPAPRSALEHMRVM